MSKIFRIAILAFTVAMTTSFVSAGLAMSQTATTEAAKPTAVTHSEAATTEKPAVQVASAKTHSRHSRAKAVAQKGGHVYLLRGLLNIFSLGMDELADKLKHRGIDAAVYEYGNWESLCEDAAQRYRSGRGPIILVGHSLGADSVIYMSNRLGKMGIPVALVVAFDPVHPVPLTGSTTASFVNLYQSDNGWGQPVRRGRGFRGNLSNVDLRKHTEISHTTIDKSPMLHKMVIGRVLGIMGRGHSTRSAGAKSTKHAPVAAKTSETPKTTSASSTSTVPAAAPAATTSSSASLPSTTGTADSAAEKPKAE